MSSRAQDAISHHAHRQRLVRMLRLSAEATAAARPAADEREPAANTPPQPAKERVAPERGVPAAAPARPTARAASASEPVARPAVPAEPGTTPAVPAAARPKAEPQRAAAPAADAHAAVEPPHASTATRLTYVLLAIVLVLGWYLPTERYITPKRGFGYALGIIGGSLMLVLLLYSARKRFSWLRFLGATPSWFRFHMVLGIVGPLCILFHSNFRTGAPNSNVALWSMLTVAGSGFIGRYLYAHIHHGLYGSKLELGELRVGAADLKELSGSISFMPVLAARLEEAEQRMLACGPRLSLLGFLKPALVRSSALRSRWRLHRYVRRGLRSSARENPLVALQAKRLRRAVRAYIDRRLLATRRVAEFEGYERLFSLWHALHIPLIFMLAIAAVVHVIAVNVY